jgi:iron(III) transport system ATP-binding protein
MHLKVTDLSKTYSKGNILIDSLSFSLERGEIASFFGESGVGKTTFLKCLSGLENIDSGSIELNDTVLNSLDTFVTPQKRNIGFVFQDCPLFPHLTLKENILFNLNINFHSKLDYMLSLTKLDTLVDRYPHQLSGGEQQRTCIARALIREPDLLLLDEPFSNLDVAIKNSIRDEIYNIIKTLKTTTILVTHDIHDSLNISDKILVFSSGKLQQFDSPENVYSRPKNLYCANIIGGVNKYVSPLKKGYIRPENINIVKNSPIKLIVKSCIFEGKEYKISGLSNKQIWSVYSDFSYRVNDELNLQFDEDDLIELN